MSIISYNQFQAKYRFDCQLSQGSFGRVCRIQQIGSKKFFALKKVAVKKKQELEDIENEIRLLNQFRNPFIVQIKETYNIQNRQVYGKPIREVGIVMELAKCSLEHFIRMKKQLGSVQFVITQIAGLAKILFALQKQNIAHRDIKPANILIFENPDNSYKWKLADFGLALDLSIKGQQDNFAGSFQYASPKLKRKFAYPNLKLKTNPFKDDVYSFGVTLLESITGLRTYNTVALQKLKEECPQKNLVNLIDMMLEEDEEKRPCFKQIIMLLERDFPTYVQDYESENIKQINNFHKKLSDLEYKDQSNNTDKTVIKRPQKHVKKLFIQTGRPIQCVANYGDLILCGCERGDLLIIKSGNVINCGNIHNKAVSQFFVDKTGNIWSIGKDAFAKKWKKNEIQKSLIQDVKQVTITGIGLMRKKTERKQLMLQIKQEQHYDKIGFPFFHACGASAFLAEDANNLGVGFNNGYVYIKWDENQFHGKLFQKPVTAIKYLKQMQKMWVCSMDGQVKTIDLKQMRLTNRLFYKKDMSFIGMYVDDHSQEQFVVVLTLDGWQYTLNKNLECVLETTVSKNMILSFCQMDRSLLLLTDEGQIIQSNQQKVLDLHGQGWNCLWRAGEQDLVVASYDGQVAYVWM